ncbi:unnamed protein product [Angiostrongylus costaricensis]|uniref:Peptidase_M1_N domain-containing protein n=1 Tax=Angiostrongylus costaricensis TaxID=334426 RepID=A0A0R3PLH7_ANGCS|nr:unnamed protein product [Angiostrongylus costaricensis]
MSSSRVVDESRTASGKGEPTEGFTYSAWSPAPTTHRSTAAVLLAVLSAIFMFIFGVLFGALLHSILFSNKASQLALMNSTVCDPNAVPPPCDQWSLSESHDNKVETLTTDAYRLPRDIAPKSYNLTIHPNIAANKLTGNVVINIEHVCPKWSQWAFVLDAKLVPGEFVQLGIEFKGEVLADMSGLYISTHTDSFGRRLQSAVTQFEPTDARKMFPCFDEPNFKATFQVTHLLEITFLKVRKFLFFDEYFEMEDFSIF